MMEKMKKFVVYVDDEVSVFKVNVAATDEESAKKYVAGNGEIIAVKDVTDKCRITMDDIADLLKSEVPQQKIDFIVTSLLNTGIISMI